MRNPARRSVLALLAVLWIALPSAARADLTRVRHERAGSGHLYLSTHAAIPIGGDEVALAVFVLPDRYVAVYTQLRRTSESSSEVVATLEVSGRVSGFVLEGLGSTRLLGEEVNGRPVAELTLDRALGIAPSGLIVRLAWTYGSWAPPSV